jgi:type VI secretion system secreted protein Hcp
MFIKIGDIKGESHDDKHKDEIDIMQWSWGVSQAGTMAGGGGGGAGKAAFQDIHFTHLVDKASPVLAQMCSTGTHIKEATLTVRKAGKGQQEYYIVKLNDLLVSSVQTSGSDGQGVPTESVSLNFAKIHFDYKPQKSDGTLEAAVTFKYDLKANKQL